MNELFAASATAGVVISLIAYWIGMLLKNKFKSGILNPLLIAIILVIAFLLLLLAVERLLRRLAHAEHRDDPEERGARGVEGGGEVVARGVD